MPSSDAPAPKRFLFLQGPITPFFDEVGAGLRALGHAVHRINLNLGDKLFWRGPGAVDFRGRLAEWPSFIEGFLDRHAITDMVLLGEQRSYNRIALAAAHARGVRVAARGSGAGSLVNHLLGISGVDPIRHRLLMERFCSPLRAELPEELARFAG